MENQKNKFAPAALPRLGASRLLTGQLGQSKGPSKRPAKPIKPKDDRAMY